MSWSPNHPGRSSLRIAVPGRLSASMISLYDCPGDLAAPRCTSSVLMGYRP